MQMKILVINDDGIASPGLWAAVRALRKVGEVFAVAPAREQSGVGASLTLALGGPGSSHGPLPRSSKSPTAGASP